MGDRSTYLQSSKGTGFCIVEVVPSVRLGGRHEMFQWRLLWHTTLCAKGVAELSSLKRYNQSKRGLLHCVEHYAGQISMAAITENHFCERSAKFMS